MSNSKTFLSDIKKIRLQARKHLTQGAVTRNYHGKVQDAIALLNQAVAVEPEPGILSGLSELAVLASTW